MQVLVFFQSKPAPGISVVKVDDVESVAAAIEYIKEQSPLAVINRAYEVETKRCVKCHEAYMSKVGCVDFGLCAECDSIGG